MNTQKLAGLQPAKVFAFFEQLCAIPHGSGNTKAISDWLVGFAKERGLRYIQDATNNVILFADATAGYEDHPAVILQGHMDMVCDKDADCTIDMEKEGLDIAHDGQWVFANGTTLGADNGIAVAYALAVLDDPTIAHPPLEVLITVDEETGMFGAMDVDMSCLQGRMLINMDSGDEGVFTVSCAGGIRGTIHLPVQRRAVYGPCIRLVVDGLKGGHSGVEIHRKHANANKVMGELLGRVQKLMPLCLTSLCGGSKDNVITHSCQATAVMLGMYPERINEIAAQLEQEIRDTCDEPDVKIYGENVDGLGGNALTSEDTAKVIALLCAVPNGVQKWSQEIPGLVQTSLNAGILTLDEELRITFAVRSSVNDEKREVLRKLEELAKFYGGSYSECGDYPAWEFKKESVLRDTMVNVYKAMYGKDPQVIALHAGLECGLFCGKVEGLDCVSMGPDMVDIHSSREKLSIASTQRTWEYLLEVLKNL